VDGLANFGSLIMLAGTAGAFLLVAWVAAKRLVFVFVGTYRDITRS
jgi:hypothetical protein